MRRTIWIIAAAAVAASTLAAPHRSSAAGPSMTGLHFVGNRLENGEGQVVRLIGMNRNDSHYFCRRAEVDYFETPVDDADIDIMQSWGINTVKLNMAEDCWLNRAGVTEGKGGQPYKDAIKAYVDRLTTHGMAVVLDNHGVTYMPVQRTDCEPIDPYAEFIKGCDAPRYWQEVAAEYKDYSNVLFELFDEPTTGQLDSGGGDEIADWECLRDGGADCEALGLTDAVGMQDLVDAVRSTGATNPIFTPGLRYANSLNHWLDYMPVDPAGQIGALFHAYKGNPCDNLACWEATVAPVAAQVPVFTGEFGEQDCKDRYVKKLMTWMDQHTVGYAPWAWTNPGAPCDYLTVIKSYDGRPTRKGQYGRAVYKHYRRLSGL